MPRYVEPKSELAFRNAKAGPKPYLLPDGQGLSLLIRPNGAKTWLLRYRRPGTGKENFLSLGPYPPTPSFTAPRTCPPEPKEHHSRQYACRQESLSCVPDRIPISIALSLSTQFGRVSGAV
ncbi:Arm DNA-binding domain-containing protein [Caballeronia sp. SEWSISQ10-4 2]|uniref:Arm DNA-binding domain-containing protein n=1 Tax=Caballeronia sp. SEWSISQ10-4 2 TaxID=2937438 RepID=UPI0026525B75|nr:Arm DNA-binding domain-containing protein [Caballeronia sp. SEWSISQ10-4 2]MDN7184238.1 Arm DNA-binding domain-containing protein [Caballeronia sp. SEWSISQ10-4 2]